MQSRIYLCQLKIELLISRMFLWCDFNVFEDHTIKGCVKLYYSSFVNSVEHPFSRFFRYYRRLINMIWHAITCLYFFFLYNPMVLYIVRTKTYRCFSFCVLNPQPAWQCSHVETSSCACQAYIRWLRHTPAPPWPAMHSNSQDLCVVNSLCTMIGWKHGEIINTNDQESFKTSVLIQYKTLVSY